MFLKARYSLLLVLAVAFMCSCSDDDTPTPAPVVPDVEVEEPETDEPTAEELAEMAAIAKYAAANSVIRALSAVDELPDNWESTTFEPSVGIPVDEANTDVRNMIADDAAEAENYFHNIVTNDGLEGNTWSHEGVGSLTFRVMNEADCYAVIDVNLLQIPGLKQLRFVPAGVVGDNAPSFKSYYKVGDIVVYGGATWICVRPSGGPKKKDYAYFVSFDENTIKTTTVDQKIYGMYETQVSKKKPENKVSGEWTYATNLIEKRIAISAAHTFAMLWDVARGKEDTYGFGAMGKLLKDNNLFDITNWVNVDPASDMGAFYIPYGSYTSSKHRKLRQEKKLQPVLSFVHANTKDGYMQAVQSVMEIYEGKKLVDHTMLMSLTTDFDPQSYNTFNSVGKHWGGGYGYSNKPFNILEYLSEWEPTEYTVKLPTNVYFKGDLDLKVMLMAQMRVKDHGKPDEHLFQYDKFERFQAADYWGSLDKVTRTITDEKKVDKQVDNLYE